MRAPILTASIQTNSCASSNHFISNFSWQIGQTLPAKAGSSGTGSHCSFGPLAAASASLLTAGAAPELARCSSSTSRDLIQSYVLLASKNRLRYVGTYQLIDEPTSMLASLLRLNHTLVHLEVPVHVSSLLLLSLLIGPEATSTLGARNAKILIKRHNQMWARTIYVSNCIRTDRLDRRLTFSETLG